MNKRTLFAMALLLGAAISLGAQNRYNPAQIPDHDYIGAAGLMFQDYRNFGLSTFLYPLEDGKLVTFLHPMVSTEKFDSHILPDNYIFKKLSYNALSYGFHRGEALHSFELNLQGTLGISLPGEPFQLIKNGTSEWEHQLGHLRGELDLYLELAYGYSRRIGDKLSVGGRVKLLAGLYGVDYNATKLRLTMNERTIQAEIEAELNLTDKLVKFSAGDDGFLDWKTFIYKGIGNLPTGGGVAVDLGVCYEPMDGLEVSASVLDLGGIMWYYGNRATSSGKVVFTGFNDLTIDQMNLDGLKEQFGQIKDDALNSLKLTPSDSKWRWKRVPFSANAAIKYALPFYDRLKLGVTGNYMSYQWMPYWETRFGAKAKPLDWMEVAADLGTGAFGMVWGLSGSFRVQPFRFSVGMNNGFGGTAPISRRPITANNQYISFGIMYEL